MSYVWDSRIANVAAQIIWGEEHKFDNCQALGFLDKDKVVQCAIVYHNWQPESQVIEISAGAAAKTWLNKARLLKIFAYPFEELNCRMVVARIGENNARARRIWRSLGASEYIIPALRSPQEAEVIYTLSKQAWESSKFMRGKNGH